MVPWLCARGRNGLLIQGRYCPHGKGWVVVVVVVGTGQHLQRSTLDTRRSCESGIGFGRLLTNQGSPPEGNFNFVLSVKLSGRELGAIPTCGANSCALTVSDERAHKVERVTANF